MRRSAPANWEIRTGSRREPHVPMLIVEPAGDFVSAYRTKTRFEGDGDRLISGSANHLGPAIGTVRTLVSRVVDVSGVRIPHAGVLRDFVRLDECLDRGRFAIQHFEVGVEGRKMHRHVRSQPFDHPVAHPRNLVRIIVFPRNNQRRQLNPYVRFIRDVFERFQDGLQAAVGQVAIKPLRKRLQIDIRRVHVAKELFAGFFADIAVRHGHGPDVPFVAFLGRVDGVLGPNDRIVVREGHAFAFVRERRFGDRLRERLVRIAGHLARPRTGPVLTEKAS